ncbi:hypothetical protein R0135_01595 [Congregibacter variabilis]|uniref:DUF3160 domain-containing protein n=1 Tax=Congregibacter variabilis TaxID=3081200 RepID=A0ABZ0I309_9GAMM|nr:hypothetical protein R0135_01595 [Congregibacter sp. IMCC43200]
MSDIKLRHYIDSMRLLPTLIFLKLLLFTAHAVGAAQPYGKNFVQLDATWAEEEGPAMVLAPAPMAKPEMTELVRAISERLTQQEFRDGPYAVGLAETLDELARAQEAVGAREDARHSRDRALHLIRVNDGLYSTAQRPILRAILDSLRRDGDFAALDERYDYFFRLYGSGRPPWDGLRWSAVMEYLRWQREALRRGLDSDPMPRLLRLHGLHEDLLASLVLQVDDLDFRRLADATFSQLKTLYLIEDMIRPQPQPLLGKQRNGFYRSQDPRDFNLQQERLESLQRMVRGTGRGLIEELLAVIPPQESKARAEAVLALADWLQWHGATREARGFYEDLWTELRTEGLHELAQRWFSQPVALPDNGVFFERGLEEGEGPMAVRLSVRENGRASADTAPLAPRWQRSAIQLQRYIAATRFRPVIKNGQVSAAENIPVSYWLFSP